MVERVDRQRDPVPILRIERRAGDGDVGSADRLEAPRRRDVAAEAATLSLNQTSTRVSERGLDADDAGRRGVDGAAGLGGGHVPVDRSDELGEVLELAVASGPETVPCG